MVESSVLTNAVQGIFIWPFPGLVNFVPAVAYHFCLNLPAAFSQPGNGHTEIPCTVFDLVQQIQCFADSSTSLHFVQAACTNFPSIPLTFPYLLRQHRT